MNTFARSYSTALCEHLRVNQYKYAPDGMLDFDQLEREIENFAEHFETVMQQIAQKKDQ